MRKHTVLLLTMTMALGMMLSACASNNNNGVNDNGTETPGVSDNANQDVNPGDVTDPAPGDEAGDADTNGNAGATDPADTDGAADAELNAKSMIDQMVEQVEQPSLMELQENEVEQIYHLDPALLEEYSLRVPLMNIKTNEVSIMKVKDEADLPVVEEALKQRAEDVQKIFETYLQDQYENAKNYQIVVQGNYVLFVISAEADQLVELFNGFFE